MSVYFIRDADRPEVKIGHSCEPHHRLVQLRSVRRPNLQLLKTVLGGRSEEKAMHLRFQEYHIEGEWFRLEGKLLKFIGRKRPAKFKPIRQVFRETVVAMLKKKYTHEQIAKELMMTVPALTDYMKTENIR